MGGTQAEFAISAVLKMILFPQRASTLLLTLGPEAGIHPAMSNSHLARRISSRARRLSAGVWDMRIC